MPKGLTFLEDNINQNDLEDYVHKNYNSAFFENDQAVEQYNKQIKGALGVQYEREATLKDPLV